MRKKATGFRLQASGLGVRRCREVIAGALAWKTCAALLIVVALTLLASPGCEREEKAAAASAQVELMLDPSPPVVGDAQVTVALSSVAGEPIHGATVRLEGNMNHAGMRPSFADLAESREGEYSGTLDFTMAGDWFVVVNAKLADGSRVEKVIDVPGVRK